MMKNVLFIGLQAMRLWKVLASNVVLFYCCSCNLFILSARQHHIRFLRDVTNWVTLLLEFNHDFAKNSKPDNNK